MHPDAEPHPDAAASSDLSERSAARTDTVQIGGYLSDRVTNYAIFALSPRGIIESWNAGAERAFGYTRNEIVGRSFAAIFTPEDIVAGAPERELRSAEAEGGMDCDRWHVRKDGSYFWGTNTVERTNDETGR